MNKKLLSVFSSIIILSIVTPVLMLLNTIVGVFALTTSIFVYLYCHNMIKEDKLTKESIKHLGKNMICWCISTIILIQQLLVLLCFLISSGLSDVYFFITLAINCLVVCGITMYAYFHIQDSLVERGEPKKKLISKEKVIKCLSNLNNNKIFIICMFIGLISYYFFSTGVVYLDSFTKEYSPLILILLDYNIWLFIILLIITTGLLVNLIFNKFKIRCEVLIVYLLFELFLSNVSYFSGSINYTILTIIIIYSIITTLISIFLIIYNRYQNMKKDQIEAIGESNE